MDLFFCWECSQICTFCNMIISSVFKVALVTYHPLNSEQLAYHGDSIQIRPSNHLASSVAHDVKKWNVYSQDDRKADYMRLIHVITVYDKVLEMKRSVLQMASEQRHLRIRNLRER